MTSYLLTNSQKRWAIAGIGTSALMISTEFYIVGAIIPVLMEYFHASFMTVQWIILIYTLVLTAMVLGVARLGDIYDKKQLFLIGLLLFTVSSLLCGLASSITALIVFRGLQGLGAVLIWALRNAIVTEIFPEDERGQAIGWVTGLSSLGLAIGPGIGGLLIGIGGWRLLFWINLPLGLLAGLIVARYIPNCLENGHYKKFDTIGLLLMFITLSCFVLGTSRLQDLSSIGFPEIVLMTLSLVGFICFWYIESQVEEPILDLELFQLPKINTNLLLFFAVYIIVGLIQLAFPLFLELGLHYPTNKVGFLLTVLPLMSVIVSPVSGSLSDQFGGRNVSSIGLLLIIIGCLACSTLNQDSTVIGFCLRGILVELGLIISVIPISKVVMDTVQQEQFGIASGLLALSRMIGIVMGTCLFGIFFYMFTVSNSKLLPNLENSSSMANPLDMMSLPVITLIHSIDSIFLAMALIASAAVLILVWELLSISCKEKA